MIILFIVSVIIIVATSVWLVWLDKDTKKKQEAEEKKRIDERREKEEAYRLLNIEDDKLEVPKGFVRVHIGDAGYLLNLAQVSFVRRDNSHPEQAEIVCSNGKKSYTPNEPYEEVLKLIDEAKNR